MDYRLTRVHGQRLVHLTHSDAPRVAQALIDKMLGRARISGGTAGFIPYIEFILPNVYSVVIRADDWRRIFPLVRYGTGHSTPIIPPADPPEWVPSPQGNRNMNPAPENPGAGFTSFLEHFTWEEYSQIQRLVTMTNVGREAPALSYKAFERASEPVALNPAAKRPDALWVPDDVYTRLVGMLELLFPRDFPTSKV